VDVDKAGGIGVIAQRLVEGKYVDGSALTCTGRTFGEEAAKAVETPGQKVIRPLEQSAEAAGGLAILRGSLAPEGCVIKLSGHNKRHTSDRRACSNAKKTPSSPSTMARSIRRRDGDPL
jgi:dihydroxy-acid dehydratase